MVIPQQLACLQILKEILLSMWIKIGVGISQSWNLPNPGGRELFRKYQILNMHYQPSICSVYLYGTLLAHVPQSRQER